MLANVRSLTVLLLLSASAQLHSQVKPAWREELAVLERSSAKLLLPLNQLLLDELSTQLAAKGQSADVGAVADLKIRIATASARQQKLAKGEMWYPARQEAAWGAFCLEAAGKKWELRGTRNLLGFRVDGREIVWMRRDGGESAQSHGDTLIPGIFHSRWDGQVYSMALISPDQRRAMCCVATHIYESAPPVSAPDVVPTDLPSQKVTRDPKSDDIATALSRRVSESSMVYEDRVSKLMGSHFKQVITNGSKEEAAEFIARRAVNISAKAFYQRQGSPSIDASISAGGVTRRVWQFPRLRLGARVELDGDSMWFHDGRGGSTAVGTESKIWPGLIRFKPTKGRGMLFAKSADGLDAVIIETVSEFTGLLVE